MRQRWLALVTRVVLDGKRAVGVEFLHEGAVHRITARCETVLSLGAFNTPKALMHSGIGDERELTRAGIEVAQHLPGVGHNFQDHILVPCVWEYHTPLPPRNNGGEATLSVIDWRKRAGQGDRLRVVTE